MRTTVDLDEDILAAARELARIRRTSLGREISQLARQALRGASASAESAGECVGGFRPFRSRGRVVTNEDIDRLRDEEGA